MTRNSLPSPQEEPFQSTRHEDDTTPRSASSRPDASTEEVLQGLRMRKYELLRS